MKIAAEKRKKIIHQIGKLEMKYCRECPIQHYNRSSMMYCHSDCAVGKQIHKLGKELLGGESFRRIKKSKGKNGRKPKYINKEDVIRMYQDGYSLEVIGKKYNFSPDTIRQKLRLWGVYVPKQMPEIRKVNEDKLISMYKQGKSKSYIARKLGVSTTLVYSRLKKNGLK